MLKQRHYFYKIIAVCCFFVLVGCNAAYVTKPFISDKNPIKPDYQNEDNWAVLPSKYTNKISELTSGSISELEADVFYVYPTLITNKKDIRWNIATKDSLQNIKVLNTAVDFQASA